MRIAELCVATLLLSLVPNGAIAATRGHALLGANATQITITGEGQTSISNGYAAYTLGGGFSYIPNRNLVIELDAFFTQRKFGFADTSASFSTFQFPLTAQYHFWQYHVGSGLYSALWSFDGQMVNNGATSSVSVEEAGQSTSEIGLVVLAGLTQRVFGYPLRFEIRRFQSLTDVAKSASFKGKLIEWQLLAGYEIETDPLLAKWFGIGSKGSKSSKGSKGSGAGTSEKSPPSPSGGGSAGSTEPPSK